MTIKIVWGFSILAACAIGTQAFATAASASTPNAKASAGSVRLAQGSNVSKSGEAPKKGTARGAHQNKQDGDSSINGTGTVILERTKNKSPTGKAPKKAADVEVKKPDCPWGMWTC